MNLTLQMRKLLIKKSNSKTTLYTQLYCFLYFNTAPDSSHETLAYEEVQRVWARAWLPEQ